MPARTSALALVAALVLVSLPLAVHADAVAEVVLSPATAAINLRQSVQFTVAAYDANGTPVAPTDVQWSSSQDQGSIKAVDANGRFKPVAAGVATVTVVADGVTAEATVTVSDRLVATSGLASRAYADGRYAPLEDHEGFLQLRLQDGSSPGTSGFVATFEQIGPEGVVLLSTFVRGTTDAAGDGTFAVPRAFTLPGDYRVSVSAYDGANAGNAGFEYSVAY